MMIQDLMMKLKGLEDREADREICIVVQEDTIQILSAEVEELKGKMCRCQDSPCISQGSGRAESPYELEGNNQRLLRLRMRVGSGPFKEGRGGERWRLLTLILMMSDRRFPHGSATFSPMVLVLTLSQNAKEVGFYIGVHWVYGPKWLGLTLVAIGSQ